ncbi:TPA: hypothetical protein ACJK0D_003744, partial [Acinetobacter baumannii]
IIIILKIISNVILIDFLKKGMTVNNKGKYINATKNLAIPVGKAHNKTKIKIIDALKYFLATRYRIKINAGKSLDNITKIEKNGFTLVFSVRSSSLPRKKTLFKLKSKAYRTTKREREQIKIAIKKFGSFKIFNSLLIEIGN